MLTAISILVALIALAEVVSHHYLAALESEQ
jgi:hypothetical protein